MENFKIILLINAMAIAACTQPLEHAYSVDGPRNAMFSVDLNACQQLATTHLQGTSTADAISEAVVGTLGENSDTDQRNIVIRCLQNRGHAVVG